MSTPLRPDEVCVVVLLPFHQHRVPPLHEGVQVGPGRAAHVDQVLGGPDLHPHQGNEGPQRLVHLRGGRPSATLASKGQRAAICGMCPEMTETLTHHVDKVDNFKYPPSQLGLISLHLLVLKRHAPHVRPRSHPVSQRLTQYKSPGDSRLTLTPQITTCDCHHTRDGPTRCRHLCV